MTRCFDIETGPLPQAQLDLVKPTFQAPTNYTDKTKIAAKLVEMEEDWRKTAALSAITGRVLCIGFLDDATRFIHADDERAVLEAFWQEWNTAERMIGFACRNFDAKFLYQRSILLGVPTPKDLFVGRYWNPKLVDLQEHFTCFSREIRGMSLDAVCRAAGIGQKNGSGEFFSELWATDRQAALSYLAMDLELTWKLAERLGVVSTVPF